MIFLTAFLFKKPGSVNHRSIIKTSLKPPNLAKVFLAQHSFTYVQCHSVWFGDVCYTSLNDTGGKDHVRIQIQKILASRLVQQPIVSLRRPFRASGKDFIGVF